MTKLKLVFEGKRNVSTENEYGAHIRVNISNGNFNLSPLVGDALGIKQGDRINFSYAEDGVYIAKMPEKAPGNTLGKKLTFASETHGRDFAKVYAKSLGEGHDVVILHVDAKNKVEDAEAEANGEEITVTAYPLVFKTSFMQRKITKGKEDAKEEPKSKKGEESLV